MSIGSGAWGARGMRKDDLVCFRTRLERDPYKALEPPIYLSVVYEFIDEDSCVRSDRGKPIKYSREENPTVRMLETIVRDMERAEDALAFGSGMAAISCTLIAFAERGSKMVVSMEMYSSTLQLVHDIAEKMGLRIVKVWPSADRILDAVDRDTRLVLVETITNPTLKVIDVEKLAKELPCEGALLVVDNTMSTPLLVKPVVYGADVVIHSTTKYLAGHNDVVGGVAAGRRNLVEYLWDWRRKMGSIQHPFEAYLTIRGMKTFPIRFEKQCRNAQVVAEFLEDHPRVEEVMYPGLSSSPYYTIASRIFERKLFGAVVSFRVRGGKYEALRFLRRLKIITPSTSFGGVESTISIPMLSAAKYIPPEDAKLLGISSNLLRLSVGIEDVEHLIEDLDRALTG